MADLLATPPQIKRQPGTVLRVNCKDLKAVDKIAGSLINIIDPLQEYSREKQRLVICIGSDRSTGDSLGPLVGAYLKQLPPPERQSGGRWPIPSMP